MLTPEDYGVVAIATILMYLFDAISNTGAREYIIHKSPLNDDILCTAWTLNIITKTIVWLLFLLLIPVFSEFYSKPELNEVFFVISLILPINAFKNIGIILFEKELNYKPLLYLDLSQKLIAFVITLSFAIWLKNYWALIIGNIASFAMIIVGSYIIHDFRPRFTLYNIKEQWNFSKWMLPRGLLGFSKAEFDTFIVSKIFDFSSLGGFNIMKSLTSMVAESVIMPATDPLLASFSKVNDDYKRLRFQVFLSLFVIVVITLPITIFLWMFHKEVISLLFGAQWVSYSSVLGVLSVLIVAYSILGILNHLLTSLGKIKAQFYYELFGLTVTAVTLLTINFNNLVEFSAARSLLVVALVMLLFVYVIKIIKLPVIDFISLLLPVIIPIIIAVFITRNVYIDEDLPLIIYLLLYGLIFSTTYIISLITALFFYRNREEISYLQWVITQVVEKIQSRYNKSKK